ncbi:MAG: AraC family transcriptional regulator [Anaerolineae bacterium]|nr:AraC family transcriptional regulator [Candidatus Roseilinea sp.]MDW8450077.1 AraC family transcriptional regulator [Anaerolineae bacterium]
MRTKEQNLTSLPGTKISASVMTPVGSGARDPRVLLNETVYHLDGQSLSAYTTTSTYDTYDGQNEAVEPDWYEIEFPDPVTFNCIEMTMGFPYWDGGWWCSLNVETRSQNEALWQPVSNLKITPPYDFAATRAKRRPFETYCISFDEVTAPVLRIIGRPGGIYQFTSLARLAVYQRNLSLWNPTLLPDPPLPYIFQLIAPETIWDLSRNFMRLTGMTLYLGVLEFYLDEERYQEFWQHVRRMHHGEPNLWFLIGETIGWRDWNRISAPIAESAAERSLKPHVYTWFHDALAVAVAPVIVEGKLLGELMTDRVIVKDRLDLAWHRSFALEHGIPWSEYEAALNRSVQMTQDQLGGAAGLLGMIANVIANLAHRNLYLEQELCKLRAASRQHTRSHRQIVGQAIEFMQANLETPLSINDVARAVGYSPSYFCEVFTDQAGRSPKEFLIDLRIERAKEYLAHTKLSVQEVCAALGYDSSYFSRLFRSRTGCTPSEYARRMRSGGLITPPFIPNSADPHFTST